MPRQRKGLGILTENDCPIPGCRDKRVINSLLCLKHGVEVWQHVQSVRGDPIVADAILESVAEREHRLDEAYRRSIEVGRSPGRIYYVRVDEKIKIGWSSNLDQRLKAYPPHMILLADHPGSRADERDLHRSFAPFRVSGREWYEPSDVLLDHIKGVLKTQYAHSAELWRLHMEQLPEVPRPVGRPVESRSLRAAR